MFPPLYLNSNYKLFNVSMTTHAFIQVFSQESLFITGYSNCQYMYYPDSDPILQNLATDIFWWEPHIKNFWICLLNMSSYQKMIKKGSPLNCCYNLRKSMYKGSQNILIIVHWITASRKAMQIHNHNFLFVRLSYCLINKVLDYQTVELLRPQIIAMTP